MRIYSLAFFDLGQPQHQLGCLFVFFLFSSASVILTYEVNISNLFAFQT
jgi:hypothetical protein